MMDDAQGESIGKLCAEIEALRRQLGTRDALTVWVPPGIVSVPAAAATCTATAGVRLPVPSVTPGDAAPRYVPCPASRFWEETGVDRFRYDTFVETGSCRGDTLDFMKDKFGSVHSIELSKGWHEFCVERFKDHPHVHCHCGDSTELLPRILHRIDRPVIVFLDAHCSGGTTARTDADCASPLLAELAYLWSRPVDDIVIADDTSFFDAKGGEEPQTPEADQVWPRFAYDWSGITCERVLSLMKPGYRFLENTDSRYTLTPREDPLILYPASEAVRRPGNSCRINR